MSGKHSDAADIVIVGGGLSGLAAAVELASAGAKITLIERSPKLGGRCYSYIDEKTGDVVDNGQHVLLGAYHNTLRYLKIVGSRESLHELPALSLLLHHPVKGFGRFNVVSLPRPFHLTVGMLLFKLLSLSDRKKLLNVGFALKRWTKTTDQALASLSIEEWLTSLNQSEEAKNCVWYPLAVSIMNELPGQASALLFARSLRSAFLEKKSDSSVLIPTIGQTELYVDGALRVLQECKARVLPNTEAESIQIHNSKAVGVKIKGGDVITARHIISAVPYFALDKMIAPEYSYQKPFCDFRKIKSSPIVSIHLWFDKEFMHDDYIGLIGKTLQWVFNRRRIMREEGKQHSYITAVISGAYDTVDQSKEQLVAIALNDLHNVYQESRQAILQHSIVIKEKRATFSPTNETESLRPSAETFIHNLILAGDWTNTGLPATIEGAVMSGFSAAKLAMR